MAGLMQSWPLTADRILDHAAQWRPDCEIVARTADGHIQRTTYGAMGARTRRLATALAGLGVKAGDRVAVLGANSPRAMEAIYACIGMGAVAHPLAPGLQPARLAALIDQAQDVVLFVDPALLSGLDETLGRCTSLRHVVVMEDATRTPLTGLAGVSSHEALISQVPEGGFDPGPWGEATESDPCILFHTVGAGSGQPKGVLWPHRSTVLAAMIASDAEALGFTAEDVVLPLTPFWRSGAWGLLFAAPAAGCKLVLPGPRMDAASLLALIQSENVTFVLGSPSEIQDLSDQMKLVGRPQALHRIMVVGAACPPALIEGLHKDFGIEARCAWGMVEACGLGAIGAPGALRPPFGVELEIADAAGNRLPHDGHAIGRLKVRGPAAASAYFPEGSGPSADPLGYLDTGDLAAIDARGRVRIADRADEVLSVGGAWVSPRTIEAIALEHPATADAAVIAFPGPNGAEAPLLVVRRKQGATAGRAEYLAFVAHRMRGGQKPADAIFVDALPLDIAGRIDKRTLRERLDRHRAKTLGVPIPPPAPQNLPRPAAAAPAAPLLYSPELEPRAMNQALSEFAPIPAPAQPPAPPPAPPEPKPDPEPVSAELPAGITAVALAGAAATALAAARTASAVVEPAETLAAEDAPPSAAPEAAAPEPAAETPSPAIEADPVETPVEAPPVEPIPEAAIPQAVSSDDLALALSGEPVATPVAEPAPAVPEVDPAPADEVAVEDTPVAAETPGDDAEAAGPVEPAEAAKATTEEPAAEASAADAEAPLMFPAAPRRLKRQAPQWAQIVLVIALVIAFVPLLLVIASVIGVRYELIDWRIGLEDLGYSWPVRAAMVGVVGGIAGMFAALLAGFGKLWRRAAASLLIPVASLVGLTALHSHAGRAPPIHDVATDWKSPILFSPALAKLRGPKANAVEADPVVPAEAGTYMYRRVADVNADTCPQARPVIVQTPPAETYAQAKAAIAGHGLTLVSDDPAHGRLEATAYSPVYRFRSDLALRVEGAPSGSRIDMRAVSRVGQSDRGMNCELIGKLSAAMQGGG